MVSQLDIRHPLIQGKSDLTVQEITNEKGIQDIINLEQTVWGTSFKQLGEKFIRDKAREPNSLYLYGVYENSQLISGAWMYIEPDSSFASLWGGSTLPSFRGKGCYTALLEVRAKKAFELGHPILTVDASPMSRPILKKNVFVCIALTHGCQSPE